MWRTDWREHVLREPDDGSGGGAEGEGGSGAGEGEGGEPSYFLADGIAGTGEAPEWYKADKYKSVADQAKAYTDLESRFGGFTGAPEGDYGTENFVPEALRESVEINMEDPLIQMALPILKESNASQETVDKLVQSWVQSLHDAAVNEDQQINQQWQTLGDRLDERKESVRAYLSAQLGTEQASALSQAAMGNPDLFAAVEQLVGKSRPGALPQGSAIPAGAKTRSEIEALRFALDENGNRKMATDPEYRRMVEAEEAKTFGDQPFSEVVGLRA